MSENTVIQTKENGLNGVAGFREAFAKKTQLETTGTDFQEQRGST